MVPAGTPGCRSSASAEPSRRTTRSNGLPSRRRTSTTCAAKTSAFSSRSSGVLADQLGPAGAAGVGHRGPHEPELGRRVVGHHQQDVAVRSGRVRYGVQQPRDPGLDHPRRRTRPVRRDQPDLAGVLGLDADDHVGARAGPLAEDLEPVVVLLQDEDVLGRVGAQLVPPDLVRAVGLVVDHVEEGPRVGRPGPAVVGPGHRLRKVLSGDGVPEPQLEDLVARPGRRSRPGRRRPGSARGARGRSRATRQRDRSRPGPAPPENLPPRAGTTAGIPSLRRYWCSRQGPHATN